MFSSRLAELESVMTNLLMVYPGEMLRSKWATALVIAAVICLEFFATVAFAQTTPTPRRQPSRDFAPDPLHPLYLPPDATKIVQTSYVLDNRARGWSAIWVSRELQDGKATVAAKATGIAIYSQTGGDNPPARMLSNVRLKRVFIPFDSAGLEPSLSEQDKQEGMQPAKVTNLIWRCPNAKPCLKETVWLGYPDPEDSPPLTDSSIIEVSASKADALSLIELWRKR